MRRVFIPSPPPCLDWIQWNNKNNPTRPNGYNMLLGLPLIEVRDNKERRFDVFFICP